MTRATRRRRLRVFGAASSALAIGAGLILAVSVAGGAPHAAAANPSGTSPTVYVVGGSSTRGTIDAFDISGVRADPATLAPIQHRSSSGHPVVAVAMTADATKAVLLEEDFNAGDPLDWTVQVLDVGTGSLSAAAPLHGNANGTSDAVAIAANPTDSSAAYVATSVGEVWRIGLASGAPTIGGSPVGIGSSRGQTHTIAVSPDGLTAYLGGAFPIPRTNVVDDFIDAVPLRTGGATGAWSGPSHGSTQIEIAQTGVFLQGIADLSLAPDGSRAYAVDVGTVFSVSLLPLPASGTVFPPEQVASNTGPFFQPTAVTADPDGGTIYVGGLTQNFAGVVAALAASSGAVGSAIDLPSSAGSRDAAMSVSVSPDRHTALATIGGAGIQSGALLYPLQLGTGASMTGPTRAITLTNAAGNGGSDPALGPTPGPEAVVVAPDQAPVAQITSPGAVQVGHPITLNASASTVRYGSVDTFAWNFGDPTSPTNLQTTPTASASHTYGAAGSYFVTVTETDTAGTSIPPAVTGTGFAVDGPGQTPFRRADPLARAHVTVLVTTTPPPATTTTTTAHGHPATTSTTIKGHPATGVPVLVLNPALGAPGTIVTVTGHGFKAGVSVIVSWSVSTGAVAVTPDVHGNLPATPLLILTPDVLGPRFALASSTPQASAPFLVVPSSSEPGGSNGGLLFRSEGP